MEDNIIYLEAHHRHNRPHAQALQNKGTHQQEVKEEIVIFYQEECKGTLASSWIDEILKSILKSSHLNCFLLAPLAPCTKG